MLRIRHCLDNRLTDGGKVVSLTHRRTLLPRNIIIIIIIIITFLVLISRSKKPRLRPYGIRHTDHATPLYQQKLALTSPTSGGRSVGIARSRTKATELVR
jgi:hypothetical protein